jgi:hypothetical protein
LRTETGLYQSVADYNANTRQKNFVVESRNSYFNHKAIWEDIAQKKGTDVGLAPKKTGEPLLIIGSGQSLDDAGPLLKDWKGDTMVSSSQATTLVYYGKDPTYIVLLDPFTNTDEFVGVDTWEGRQSSIITHPCMNPILMALWPNKKYYYRPLEPTTGFYTEFLPAGYGDIIPTFMFLFSCTLSAQIGMARLLGYNPVFLVGCDFGRVNGKSRFTMWKWEQTEITGWRYETEGSVTNLKWDTIPRDKLTADFHITDTKGEWKSTPQESIISGKEVITSNNGVETIPLHIYYKRSMLCVCRLDLVDVINTSTKGSITKNELPQAEIEDVIASQGRGFESICWTKEQKLDHYDAYLASQRTYCLEFDDGNKRFVETTDPERDLKPFTEVENKQREKAGIKSMLDYDKNIERIKHVRELAKATYGDDFIGNPPVDGVAVTRTFQP